MARGITFSTERLRSLFEPKSIALVGASDKSQWSMLIHVGLQQGGFRGKVYYINPRNPTVHGQPTVPNLAAIPESVDLCYLMVGTDMVIPVIKEMIEAGIKNAVCLTGGFAEQDDHGRELQAEITRLAAENDLAIIGPNCMGFINVTHHTEAMASLPERPLLQGSICLMSLSGSLGSMMQNYTHTQGFGLSMLVSTGNEAVVSVTDALQFALEDEATKVIALFMETIRDPEHFIQVAQRARELGKPIIALKAGVSEVTARVALTHTGALTGNDKVIDALFRQLGIVRVNSIEELLITANVFASLGQLPDKRISVVAISGGVCDLSGDLGEQSNLEFPEYSESTVKALKELLPVLEVANNPLDVTGAAVNNAALMGQMLGVVTRDSQMGAVFCVLDPPRTENTISFQAGRFNSIAKALQESPVPAFLLGLTSNDITAVCQNYLKETKIPFIPGGIRTVIPAVGELAEWTQQQRAYQPAHQGNKTEIGFTIPPAGSWSEHQARGFLEEHGVPTIPARLVTSIDEAVAAAQTLGYPVVLKIASPDILHKSDIGGVRLNLGNAREVSEAFTQIIAAAEAVKPAPRLEGVLVSPMRRGGVELLVGVNRDPQWGQVLAVGLGGVWVEILKDTSLRVLPVSKNDIRTMITELQGYKLLQGARGSKAANLEAVVEVICCIAGLSQNMKDKLESLEINPLRVDGSLIEALDAVITWQER